MDDGLSVLPIAQASVLRWVLMGGNINESNFFGMAFTGCVLVPVRQPVPPWGVVLCGTLPGRGWCGVVFGALLGPEATGPFCSNAGGHLLVFLLFLLPASRSLLSAPAPRCVGVWVVVGGVWLMGLLFENYIVDASI